MRAFFRTVYKFMGEADIYLLSLSSISAIYGMILISSVLKNSSSSSNQIYVQIGAMVIGLVLFVMFSYLDVDIIADKSGLLLIFSALFIITLQFWGIGEEETGNNAWLRFLGFGIQPAEVVKVTFIIVIAKMLANHKDRKTLNTFSSIVQIALVFLLIFGLIVRISSDLGSALVYGFIFVVMLFVGGIKLRWFAIVGGLIVAVSPLIWNNFLTTQQKNRILAPFLPELIVNPQTGLIDSVTRRDVLFQSDNSVRAITSGGFRGQGLGQGRMTQSQVIPRQNTDFIFSAAGEELGFVGCVLIIALLVAIIIRCIYVGIKSNNTLGLLVCSGVAAMFLAQTFENIGMCLGLLPVIGITLPFYSYGGSSIVACFAALGIVSGIKMRPKPLRFRTL
ncbi:MAG: FtsW/RodA/SpoVE family cell cycle protein [Oscillospiraceae bacterium]|nr:FtsW/RodA/SpoVE family cell cycle protein [Oscillospiraceae bacterium]